jgi:predicted ATP-binding protein involved in virulence
VAVSKESKESKKHEETELDIKLKKLLIGEGYSFREYIRVLKSNLEAETKELNNQLLVIRDNIANASSNELIKFQSLSIEVDKKKEERFIKINYFNKIISKFYEETNKFIEVDKEESPLIVRANSKDGLKNIDLTKLSSGEKQLLIIFLTVLLQADKPFILLMDEPESSLHVEWQAMLLDSLKELNDNIQIIIATHNPLLALNRKENEIGCIDIDNATIQTQGGGTQYLDVSATLLNYFHLSSLVGTEMKQKLHLLFNLKIQDSLSNEEQEELDSLEKELGNTLATNFIYDRHYLHFLKFIKQNHDIDFDKLTDLSEEKMDLLLGEFKDLFL